VRPAPTAAQVRGSLTQCLTTTYALTGGEARLALERFLGHPGTGISRDPYLRIRTPFHKAGDGWQRELEGGRGFRRTGIRRRRGSGWARCTGPPGPR
jgi:hypothetical protein